MKKIIIRLFIALVILVVLAAVGVHLFLDGALKRGVETIGPKLTKVEVRLSSVNLSLLTGSAKLRGLFVGNPQGFKAPSAISVGSTSVALKPNSLLADKIVVQSINVQAPEITFETGLNVQENNLSKILANLEQSTAGSETAPAKEKEAREGKKLQVDDFVISGGKIHVNVSVYTGTSATFPLPEIHLKDLGQGPEGITPAELSKRVLQAIEKEAVAVATTAIADLSKGAVIMSKGAALPTTNTIDKATKGIEDLFRKKK